MIGMWLELYKLDVRRVIEDAESIFAIKITILTLEISFSTTNRVARFRPNLPQKMQMCANGREMYLFCCPSPYYFKMYMFSYIQKKPKLYLSIIIIMETRGPSLFLVISTTENHKINFIIVRMKLKHNFNTGYFNYL